jgi:hypothetical protein
MVNKSLLPPATSTALRASLAIVHDRREIATAWSRYHLDIARHTSEARKVLLRARTINEILEVRAKLLRSTTRSFHDTLSKIAESTSLMATRPHDAPKEASLGD